MDTRHKHFTEEMQMQHMQAKKPVKIHYTSLITGKMEINNSEMTF